MKNKIIFAVSLFLICCLGIYDAVVLYNYATDVPFWDIWDLTPKGSVKHFFEFYNENMQFFYFVISEVVYMLTNWNLRYFIFINFLVYIGLVILYAKILYQTQNKEYKIAYWPLFLMALLTPMLGYNWLWAFLVQTHTFILFFILAIYVGFVKENEKYSPYLCAFCLFLSIISMNVPLAIGGALAYIIKEIANGLETGIKKAIINSLKLIITLLVLMTILMQVTQPSKFINVRLFHTVLSMEYIRNLSFYLINSLSMFTLASVLTADKCLVLIMLHFIILGIAFFEQYRNRKTQVLWGIIFGILFCVCGIVAFRGGEVYSYHFSFIRHNETAFMLIPAILMVLALSKYKLIRYYGIILLIGMLYGVSMDISSQRFQFFGSLFYKNGCFCLNHYYNLKTMKDWQCQMNFPIAPDHGMKEGLEKHLSFIKTIKNCNE